MSDEPLITIVIPVRDRAMVVGDTLRSVAAQTLRPLCVVLVDNGSCDRTPEVLRLWAEMLDARGIFTRVVSEPGRERRAPATADSGKCLHHT